MWPIQISRAMTHSAVVIFMPRNILISSLSKRLCFNHRLRCDNINAMPTWQVQWLAACRSRAVCSSGRCLPHQTRLVRERHSTLARLCLHLVSSWYRPGTGTPQTTLDCLMQLLSEMCSSKHKPHISNQIKSTVNLVRLLQVERRRITLSRLIRSLELVTVGSPEEECFQAALESWRGTHQLEFC